MQQPLIQFLQNIGRLEGNPWVQVAEGNSVFVLSPSAIESLESEKLNRYFLDWCGIDSFDEFTETHVSDIEKQCCQLFSNWEFSAKKLGYIQIEITQFLDAFKQRTVSKQGEIFNYELPKTPGKPIIIAFFLPILTAEPTDKMASKRLYDLCLRPAGIAVNEISIYLQPLPRFLKNIAHLNENLWFTVISRTKFILNPGLSNKLTVQQMNLHFLRWCNINNFNELTDRHIECIEHQCHAFFSTWKYKAAEKLGFSEATTTALLNEFSQEKSGGRRKIFHYKRPGKSDDAIIVSFHLPILSIGGEDSENLYNLALRIVGLYIDEVASYPKYFEQLDVFYNAHADKLNLFENIKKRDDFFQWFIGKLLLKKLIYMS